MNTTEFASKVYQFIYGCGSRNGWWVYLFTWLIIRLMVDG